MSILRVFEPTSMAAARIVNYYFSIRREVSFSGEKKDSFRQGNRMGILINIFAIW
jgi:hypothetical protein